MQQSQADQVPAGRKSKLNLKAENLGMKKNICHSSGCNNLASRTQYICPRLPVSNSKYRTKMNDKKKNIKGISKVRAKKTCSVLTVWSIAISKQTKKLIGYIGRDKPILNSLP